MPIGGNGAQQAAGRNVVQVDAVQVIAGFLGRDCETRLLDQAPEVATADGEVIGEVARRQVREVVMRKRLQREARAAREDRDALAVARLLQLELGAVRELPHDVIEHVGGHRGGAALRDLRPNAFDDLDVEIGGGHLELPVARLEQHVGQDGNGVAAFHDALHMSESLQKG